MSQTGRTSLILDIDLVIDDIKLESASFIPDSIRFVQHNDLRFTQGYATCTSIKLGSSDDRRI